MSLTARISLVIGLICTIFGGLATVGQSQASASGFCFQSTPYADWRGWGVAISHCDAQAILNGGAVKDLIVNGAGLAGPDGLVIVGAIQLALAKMQLSDQGNGVYALQGYGPDGGFDIYSK
jgi:hypothetical protein